MPKLDIAIGEIVRRRKPATPRVLARRPVASRSKQSSVLARFEIVSRHKIIREPRREMARRRKMGGDWLRNLREAAGLSQPALAKRLGISYYNFVSSIEKGRSKLPEALYQACAKALKVPFDRFLACCLYFFHDIGIANNSKFVRKHLATA